MIICKNCHVENPQDAKYCKNCGTLLIEENKNKKKDEKPYKVKTKTKKKVKTKVKKEKAHKKRPKKVIKEGMTFFQKLVVFILTIITLASVGSALVLAYHTYKNENITVPSVIGLSYNDALEVLNKSHLNVIKEEKLTKEKEEVNIVLKQNRKAKSKVSKNTIIYLTVGVYDTSIIVPKIEGLYIDDAISILKENNLPYTVIYEESSKEKGIVLKQSIKAKTKIENNEIIVLTVAKKKEEHEENKEDPKKQEEAKDIDTTEE